MSSGIVAFLTAAMCLVIILTLGKSTIAAQNIDQQLDSPQARRMAVVRSNTTPAFRPSILTSIATLDDVEIAVGVGGAQDMFNGQVGTGGTPIPIRKISGDWQEVLTLSNGRVPQPGEIILPAALAQKAGLADNYGFLLDRNHQDFPVVGTFSSQGLIPDMEDVGLLISKDESVDRLYVLATSSESINRVSPRVREFLSEKQYREALFELPDDVTQISANIRGEFGNYSASLLVAILALGGLLIAATVFGGVISRATDLGRRRVLGASRTLLTTVVTGSTVIPALVGGIIGSVGGVALVSRSGAVPDWEFTLAILALAVLASIVASIPPALYSAYRDPVLVLRHG